MQTLSFFIFIFTLCSIACNAAPISVRISVYCDIQFIWFRLNIQPSEILSSYDARDTEVVDLSARTLRPVGPGGRHPEDGKPKDILSNVFATKIYCLKIPDTHHTHPQQEDFTPCLMVPMWRHTIASWGYFLKRKSHGNNSDCQEFNHSTRLLRSMLPRIPSYTQH